MGTEAQPKYPEILEELAATVAASLIQCGVPHAAAAVAGAKAAEGVRENFGGQLLYIPMGLGYKMAKRNAEIRRRLAAGEDRTALRREFDLTDERLRQIERDDTPSRR